MRALSVGAPGLCALTLLSLASSVRGDEPVVRGGVRVDGIAAIVGGDTPGPGVDVILRSDVELRARMAMAGTGNAQWSSVPRALLRSTLDQLVGEALIAREAERVRVRAPTRADVRRERRRLEEDAGGPARLVTLLQRLGAAPQELDRMARRRALVTAFMQANLEGTNEVTDAEVERVYASSEHPMTGSPLEEVREDLRAWIARRALAHAVRRWVEVLRGRTPVVLLNHFDSAP